ncbi:MAG: leishmanolysin-related zinc metalloendopeptidase [Gemmatimonadaceae bacterium]
MFKRNVAPVKFLARLSTVLAFVACSGRADTPGPGIVEPIVVPPTLVPGTTQAFDAALNSVLDVMPSITLKDQYGLGVANVWIKWTPSSGKVQSDSSLTDGNGRATSGQWLLGTMSGLQTVTARTGALSVVAMTASVAPGPLVALVTVSPTISGVVGSNVATPPSVKAVDAYGNGVPRIFVQFAKWNGDGSITGSGQTTNENGIATVGSWKLGPQTGTQSIRADDSRTGATTMMYAIALPAAASQIVVIEGNAQTGQADKRLCTSPVIAVRDEFGNGVGQISIVFTPGAGSGPVTEGSVVSSAGTGYATVGAWTLSGTATQTLVVTSPSVPGVSVTLTATVVPSTAYSVCARFLGDGGTPRQRQAVTVAVQRWQRVIAGHVQTSPLTEPANRCFAGAPAINEIVEDLLVFVQITAIDGPGNSVARAGPCTVHSPSSLTQMGLLQLDSADLELLLGQGTLDNMVTHEFGHVLGFGTLWRASFRVLFSGAGTDDPFFTGVSARAEFARLFSSYVGNTVPVENTGDVGTRDTHWRRSVFNNELMQGFSQANMPMSRVTVGSLGDLGYTVDLTKADPFSFTTGLQEAALRASVSRSTAFANDVLENEIWGVEKNGRRFLVRAAWNPLRPR